MFTQHFQGYSERCAQETVVFAGIHDKIDFDVQDCDLGR